MRLVVGAGAIGVATSGVATTSACSVSALTALAKPNATVAAAIKDHVNIVILMLSQRMDIELEPPR